MKIIFIVLAFSLALFGSDLLQIHKKLVPMTLLQVRTIANKSDKNIKIIIVTNENEFIKAKKIQELFPKKIKKFSLESEIINEIDINKLSSLKFDAIYSFSLDKQSYEFINNISKKRAYVTFSNSYDGLKNGLLVYIDKKKKINIYINSKSMKLLKIPFNTRFLSIVKIVNE